MSNVYFEDVLCQVDADGGDVPGGCVLGGGQCGTGSPWQGSTAVDPGQADIAYFKGRFRNSKSGSVECRCEEQPTSGRLDMGYEFM